MDVIRRDYTFHGSVLYKLFVYDIPTLMIRISSFVTRFISIVTIARWIVFVTIGIRALIPTLHTFLLFLKHDPTLYVYYVHVYVIT